ncbi:hypothetical protein CLOM_g10775 [Closterium sp. NIES-68]|nr:hypothetical protein CLOM_g10775 [Closterium sp. NIES-68]GJP80321.1 hypothetical protein CLOP_g10544 [Closterium sp. NIES-67]
MDFEFVRDGDKRFEDASDEVDEEYGEDDEVYGEGEDDGERVNLDVQDEFGARLGPDMDLKSDWDKVNYENIHQYGPRMTKWRVRKYFTYLFNETSQ